MRREGRLHGYEFDREEPCQRVKASNQPTNRSKFRSKYTQEKAGLPRYKALKKMKGQRNKALASDMATNHQMHGWALHHTRSATWLADSIEEADVDPSQQMMVPEVRVLLLSDLTNRSKEPQKLQVPTANEEQEEGIIGGDDWLDLGSINGIDDDDDDDDDGWFLC